MDEKGRERRDEGRRTGAGIRVPGPGESSSPGTSAPLDSPTIIDIPGRKLTDIPIRNISADAPTMVGASAEILRIGISVSLRPGISMIVGESSGAEVPGEELSP